MYEFIKLIWTASLKRRAALTAVLVPVGTQASLPEGSKETCGRWAVLRFVTLLAVLAPWATAEDNWQAIPLPGTAGKNLTSLTLRWQRPGTPSAGTCLLAADPERHLIVRIDPDGTETILAGICGQPGFDGDYWPAVNARLNRPTSIVVDAEGVIDIADAGNFRIRRIGRNGLLTTIAGTGKRPRPKPVASLPTIEERQLLPGEVPRSEESRRAPERGSAKEVRIAPVSLALAPDGRRYCLDHTQACLWVLGSGAASAPEPFTLEPLAVKGNGAIAPTQALAVISEGELEFLDTETQGVQRLLREWPNTGSEGWHRVALAESWPAGRQLVHYGISPDGQRYCSDTEGCVWSLSKETDWNFRLVYRPSKTGQGDGLDFRINGIQPLAGGGLLVASRATGVLLLGPKPAQAGVAAAAAGRTRCAFEAASAARVHEAPDEDRLLSVRMDVFDQTGDWELDFALADLRFLAQLEADRSLAPSRQQAYPMELRQVRLNVDHAQEVAGLFAQMLTLLPASSWDQLSSLQAFALKAARSCCLAELSICRSVEKGLPVDPRSFDHCPYLGKEGLNQLHLGYHAAIKADNKKLAHDIKKFIRLKATQFSPT